MYLVPLGVGGVGSAQPEHDEPTRAVRAPPAPDAGHSTKHGPGQEGGGTVAIASEPLAPAMDPYQGASKLSTPPFDLRIQ